MRIYSENFSDPGDGEALEGAKMSSGMQST
jgi:hypothetical protein